MTKEIRVADMSSVSGELEHIQNILQVVNWFFDSDIFNDPQASAVTVGNYAKYYDSVLTAAMTNVNELMQSVEAALEKEGQA